MVSKKVSLIFKINTVFDNPPSIHQKNIVFNISTNQRLYNQFGLSKDSISYVPYVLQPTVVYHQIIKNELEKKNIKISDKKFPYTIEVCDSNPHVSMNVKTRIYPPNLLSLTVILSGFSSISNAFEIAKNVKSKKHGVINQIIQCTIGMVQTLNHKNFKPSNEFSCKCIYYVEEDCNPDEFENLIETNVYNYINMLVQSEYYPKVGKSIQRAILEKNGYQGGENSDELILTNKQGIFYVKRVNSVDRKILKLQLQKIEDLYEIAIVFRLFLDEYPTKRRENEHLNDFYLYKITQFIEYPEAVFGLTFKHKKIWILLLEELELRAKMQSIMMNKQIKSSIEEKVEAFNLLPNNWWDESNLESLISCKIRELNKEKSKMPKEINIHAGEHSIVVCGNGNITKINYEDDLEPLIQELMKNKDYEGYAKELTDAKKSSNPGKIKTVLKTLKDVVTNEPLLSLITTIFTKLNS